MTRTTTNLPSLLRALMTLVAVTSLCGGLTVVDLTRSLRKGKSITWKGNPRYKFTILHRGNSSKYGSWFENNKFKMAEHTGTHLDAPAHFAKGRWRMDQIPPKRLIGPGVVVDVRDKVNVNATYQLTVEDLLEWELRHGKMPMNAILLVNFGWASRYPNRKKVFNTKNLKDVKSYKFPSVTPQAATWLTRNRNITALGTDTPSADCILNFPHSVHKILLEKNILLAENVDNLNSLPPKGMIIVMGALKIFEGSGAPMRMLALILLVSHKSE